MQKETIRDRKSNIFIIEDLTKARNEFFYKCRVLKKNAASVIENNWRFNGYNYIQEKGKDESFKI
jgi:hypothetical protein